MHISRYKLENGPYPAAYTEIIALTISPENGNFQTSQFYRGWAP